MDLNTLAYFIAGLIGLVIIINTLGAIRPARPQQRIAVQKSIANKPQQPNVTLDAELCKQYPLINAAYKNGYRFASYDPLIMELRE